MKFRPLKLSWCYFVATFSNVWSLQSLRQLLFHSTTPSYNNNDVRLYCEKNGDIPVELEDEYDVGVDSEWRDPTVLDRRELLYYCCLASSASTALSLTPALPAHAVDHSVTSSSVEQQQLEVLLPYSTQRRYKKVTLPSNGLSVLLVSDTATPQCQAALTVEAGQFCDTLPGIAHLMEHMVLSFEEPTTKGVAGSEAKSQDFEEWLGDRDGASNAFTANQKVCFHFSCPKGPFQEALRKFSSLFRDENIASVCRNPSILKREVRRVDSELNFDSLFAQEEHLTKAFINEEHPYSFFSKGSLDSLETVPNQNNVDVGEKLVDFFRRFYLPERAALVLVGPQSLDVLERFVYQFEGILSTAKQSSGAKDYFPGRFLQISQYKQVVLFRSDNEVAADTEKLSMQWVLDLDYRETKRLITVQQVAFVVCQFLCRRGPGSLYQYLRNRQWVVDGGIPKISVPVDVSGFQLLKLELNLTPEGFANRSRVITAVRDSLDTLRVGDSFVIERQLMVQYSCIAKLFGYSLAPRPPDAIELAFDALVYGLETVGSGQWYRFPENRNLLSLNPIRRAVKNALLQMSNPDDTLTIVTASETSLKREGTSVGSLRWRIEPISGAKFRFDDPPFNFWLGPTNAVLSKLTMMTRNELRPPVFNVLVPGRSIFPVRNMPPDALTSYKVASNAPPGWRVWTLGQFRDGLVLPKQPPERSCGRSAIVFQFLSPQPARATTRQAAYGELWKLHLEDSLSELGELGAPGGLAYDVSYNRFGIRFAFLGVSTTLPSYTRRMMRGLVSFRLQPIVIKQSVRRLAIRSIRQARGLSPVRRQIILSNLRAAMNAQVEEEGDRLFRSLTGVVCFSQGGVSEQETEMLASEVRSVLTQSIINEKDVLQQQSAIPDLSDLVYKPTWKPRFASGCFVPGVPFMADACGRIKR